MKGVFQVFDWVFDEYFWFFYEIINLYFFKEKNKNNMNLGMCIFLKLKVIFFYKFVNYGVIFNQCCVNQNSISVNQNNIMEYLEIINKFILNIIINSF